ncbi:MAG: peptidase [Sphingomonas bacterium]|uniref:M28 family metallopeptidase n=1 Tax=Sphingomonas bacterium TaxID=1895847 RepID=UPI0026140882|nr:M28 family peptidase [Sphingomonas bacterium]MDB5696433.1 peptidase [Sphingomonas bacterium]
MLAAGEQQLIEAARVDDAWSLLEEISSFVREHPVDVDRSVEMVAAALRTQGIPAQVSQMELYLSLPGAASVEADGVTYRAKPSAMSVAVPGGLTGRLVYVPGHKDMITSLLDPDQDAGGLRGLIDGRIVITDGIAGPGVVSSFAPLGAIGVIAINPGQEIHSAICTPIWGNPELRDLAKKPTIPVVSVNNPDGMTLKQLARTNTQVTITSALEEDWFTSSYVSVDIEGQVEPDKFVMLHGHIDSWDVGVGDNGTGVVTMFEVARLLWERRAELRRSVRVCWWPGHSTGRYAGSSWYADAFAIDLAENCVAQINCDSPGCRWATAYIDLFCMPEAIPFLSAAVKDTTGADAETMRPFRAADWSFNNLGVTGILGLSSTMPPELVAEKGYYRVGGNGGNIEWHTERDRIEIADRDIMLKDVRLYALATFRVANADILPFDFRLAAEEHLAALDRYQSISEFIDLAPAIEACRDLQAALTRFHDAIDAGLDPATANAIILDLERALVPAHFAVQGQFQQDPALDTPPLPAIALIQQLPKLDATKARFAKTQIVRGRNQIVAAFRRARQRIDQEGI